MQIEEIKNNELCNDYLDEYIGKSIYELGLKKYNTVKEFILKNDNKALRIVNDKWDAMTYYQNGLAIIYKNGQYGVINDKYEVVFDYDEDINYINIFSPNTLILKNKNNKKALYNLNKGLVINFDDNINFDEIKQISDNAYDVIIKEKHYLLIDNRLFKENYNYICMYNNVFILEKKNIIKIKDINVKHILTIDTNKLYTSKKDQNLYYIYNNVIYKFNLDNFKIEIEKNLFIDENNNGINLDNNSILNNYSYYYYDSIKKEFILFKEMKYGIQISIGNNARHIRWFETLKESYNFEKLFLESLLENIDTKGTEKVKKLK